MSATPPHNKLMFHDAPVIVEAKKEFNGKLKLALNRVAHMRADEDFYDSASATEKKPDAYALLQAKCFYFNTLISDSTLPKIRAKIANTHYPAEWKAKRFDKIMELLCADEYASLIQIVDEVESEPPVHLRLGGHATGTKADDEVSEVDVGVTTTTTTQTTPKSNIAAEKPAVVVPFHVPTRLQTALATAGQADDETQEFRSFLEGFERPVRGWSRIRQVVAEKTDTSVVGAPQLADPGRKTRSASISSVKQAGANLARRISGKGKKNKGQSV